jgi:hypothetical protein
LALLDGFFCPLKYGVTAAATTTAAAASISSNLELHGQIFKFICKSG